MKHILRLIFLAVICASSCFPQVFEVGAMGAYPRIFDSKLGSYSKESPKEDDTRLHGNRGYGGRFTLNTKGYYGHEVTYLNIKANMDSTTRTTENKVTTTVTSHSPINIQMAAYNFMMYMMPRGERFRPFVTGGLQGYRYSHPTFDTGGTSYRTYGGNYGGGIKIKLMQHALVRADFRHYLGGKPFNLTFPDQAKSGGIHHMMEFSFGAAFMF